jgi:hypothetical protein
LAAQKATRIEKYLKDVHAQLVLGPEERAALGNLADNLRSSEPVSPSSFTSVDKAIARL